MDWSLLVSLYCNIIELHVFLNDVDVMVWFISLGNSLLLDYDETWSRLLAHYDHKRCIVQASSFPRRR